MDDVTLSAQIASVKREIALRKNVYPKWVQAGRMKATAAEHEINCMTAVLRNLETLGTVLKRGIMGVYHHVSPDHLGRYVDEFAFRLNEGNCKRDTLDRLDSFVDGAAGKRLTYKALIQ